MPCPRPTRQIGSLILGKIAARVLGAQEDHQPGRRQGVRRRLHARHEGELRLEREPEALHRGRLRRPRAQRHLQDDAPFAQMPLRLARLRELHARRHRSPPRPRRRARGDRQSRRRRIRSHPPAGLHRLDEGKGRDRQRQPAQCDQAAEVSPRPQELLHRYALDPLHHPAWRTGRPAEYELPTPETTTATCRPRSSTSSRTWTCGSRRSPDEALDRRSLWLGRRTSTIAGARRPTATSARRIHVHAAEIRSAYEEADKDRSVKLWQDLFGDGFKGPKKEASAKVKFPPAVSVAPTIGGRSGRAG